MHIIFIVLDTSFFHKVFEILASPVLQKRFATLILSEQPFLISHQIIKASDIRFFVWGPTNNPLSLPIERKERKIYILLSALTNCFIIIPNVEWW